MYNIIVFEWGSLKWLNKINKYIFYFIEILGFMWLFYSGILLKKKVMIKFIIVCYKKIYNLYMLILCIIELRVVFIVI